MSLKRSISVSVRELVEFVLRSGDLAGDRDFVSPTRALEGAKGHRRVQASRPEGYQSEVSLSHQIETEDFVLTVKGRLDGLFETADNLLIEEIKTVSGFWNGQPDPLHWAQGKIYGFLCLPRCAVSRIEIQLTYFELESGGLTVFRQSFSREELSQCFAEITGVYLQWARDYHRWRQLRDESILKLAFPFAQYRGGQRTLAVAAYRALVDSRRLFAEAPTGIGKTISVVFPAVKAMGEGHFEKIFYLTAKTVGRTIAEMAFADLRRTGLRLRTVTLTAKDKMCFYEGQPCDASTCPFALGYFDRVKSAVQKALTRDENTQSTLQEVARQHQVCPHALALDVSLWVDAVICDYNYVFDPKTYLRRYFAEENGAYAFLVDEAHNLVDRAREMFSAELDEAQIREVKRAVQREAPACGKALDRVSRYLAALRKGAGEAESVGEAASRVTKEPPADLLPLLRTVLREAETWLVRNTPAPFREDLLELYFRVVGFVRTAESYNEGYVTIFETAEEQARLRLFCLDPSALLRSALKRGQAAVFFSATLTPLNYFREMLGGAAEDQALQLPSPFPIENLGVFVENRIATNLKERESTCDRVADAVAGLVRRKRGNYLVYFPSHKYLNRVLERFRILHPDLATLGQTTAMSESEREAFLRQFRDDHEETLVGFAVLGGIFGEGIDLVGDRLIGVVIVGVGLPQICLERDLIRDYFQERTGLGFEYAYTYPGLNRVLQAAGRVIRSETDRGVVLLIDTRFGQSRYRELFPTWWRSQRVAELNQIGELVQRFWRESN